MSGFGLVAGVFILFCDKRQKALTRWLVSILELGFHLVDVS